MSVRVTRFREPGESYTQESDTKWITLTTKYTSKCKVCHKSLPVKSKVLYNVSYKDIKCLKCPFPSYSKANELNKLIEKGRETEADTSEAKKLDIPVWSEAVKYPDYKKFGSVTPSKRNTQSI